eukprot:UN01321
MVIVLQHSPSNEEMILKYIFGKPGRLTLSFYFFRMKLKFYSGTYY